MTEFANSKSRLNYRTFISTRESLSRESPSGMDHLKWVPNTATLIYGANDAVLVDTFLTIDASNKLAAWVESSGKKLVAIFITHAHGDHFFGLQPVLARFPEARVLAHASVVGAMKKHIDPESVDSFWKKLFPGQIAAELMIAEPLSSVEFELEGEKLRPLELGHTDTDNTTCLHVPSIGLVVSGDAVYNGVHPFLGETDSKGLREWIAALDLIASIKPTSVIAGHQAPGTDHNPRAIQDTRAYLEDFQRIAVSAHDTQDLYDQMLNLHPQRLNPGSLWSSAKFAKSAGW
jgi:glyoxylase-like metal-dependent hydrolase (beta-lactamase superfamily II)